MLSHKLYFHTQLTNSVKIKRAKAKLHEKLSKLGCAVIVLRNTPLSVVFFCRETIGCRAPVLKRAKHNVTWQFTSIDLFDHTKERHIHVCMMIEKSHKTPHCHEVAEDFDLSRVSHPSCTHDQNEAHELRCAACCQLFATSGTRA